MTPRSLLNLKSNPDALLGIAGFLMGVISFLPINTDAFDINLHDTYIVIASVSLYRVFAVVLLFCWSVYIVANRLQLSHVLIWLHVVTTLVALISFIILQSRYWGLSGIPRRYYVFTEFEKMRDPFNTVKVYIIVLFAFILAQLLFLVNLSIGLIKKLTEIFNRNIIS
jgi:cytochrome c oxidase subunit 1